MATTAEYLNKLVSQKNTLADNLVTKGVVATHDETLETLVPKVLDISGGGESIKYIADGLIGYSDLNDPFVFNPVFDEALGRNVNYCDGSNGYFKSSNNTVISQLTGNITLQVLCKTSTSGAWGEIIVVGTVNGKSAISFGRNENCYLAISDASSAIVTNTIINNDSWHMLTVTYSNGVVCTYVDGVCVGTYNNNINIPSNSVITIGQWLTGVSKYIGYATNACIYNRALPDAEIIQNWEVDVERYGIGETKTY